MERGETGADIPAVYTRDGRTGNGPMGNGPAENRLSENERTENTPTENERTNSPTGNERTGNGRRSYLPAIEVEFEPELTGYYWKRSGMLNIQTKRGCPYECIYCSYPHIDGRCVRTMDPEIIAENILRAKRDYGIKLPVLHRLGVQHPSRIQRPAGRNAHPARDERRVGRYFSPRASTPSRCGCSGSGLTHIEFGTESFCDRTLEAYGKRFTFGDVVRASRLRWTTGSTTPTS